MGEVNEKTKVPLSLLIVILGATFSVGVAWAQLAEIRAKQDRYTAALENIDQRLSNIEGRLGTAETIDRRLAHIEAQLKDKGR